MPTAASTIRDVTSLKPDDLIDMGFVLSAILSLPSMALHAMGAQTLKSKLTSPALSLGFHAPYFT
jgi:hypothetical protein